MSNESNKKPFFEWIGPGIQEEYYLNPHDELSGVGYSVAGGLKEAAVNTLKISTKAAKVAVVAGTAVLPKGS